MFKAEVCYTAMKTICLHSTKFTGIVSITTEQTLGLLKKHSQPQIQINKSMTEHCDFQQSYPFIPGFAGE